MKNKIAIALVIAVLVAAFTITSYQFGYFERAENLIYDVKTKLYRSKNVPPKNIKVVLIDEASIGVMEKIDGRWPSPRAIYSDQKNGIL